MIARNTSPPTTPPAIAPALDRDLPADAEVLEVLDEADEEAPVETLVLVDIADEVVEIVVLARSDVQVISFIRSLPDFYDLPSWAANTLKVLFVYERN